MILQLFTDFGADGPYVGQMTAVLLRHAPNIPVVSMLADAPTGNVRASAYLLAALAQDLPRNHVVVAVVDPGVGSDERLPCILNADDRWFVGPGNGLCAIVARRARHCRWWRITWQPPRLSATFHGRDLFAPVAAMLARGEAPLGVPIPPPTPGHDWPDDLSEVIYVDHFGNAMTGLRAGSLPSCASLGVAGCRADRIRTFADMAPGQLAWLENSLGLAELVVNRGRASAIRGIGVGAYVTIER